MFYSFFDLPHLSACRNMVHFMSISCLSCLFPIFPPRYAHTRDSYFPLFSFCVYVPLWYNHMSSVTQIQTYLLPLSLHVSFFPPRTSISLSLPDLFFQPLIFFSSLACCIQTAQYHVSTSLHACWGGFCFLSWLPSSMHWNKPSGTSLKRSSWDVNVWLFWSLKVSLHLMPNR